MIDTNVSNLIATSTAIWKPSKVPGVQYLPLRADSTERSGTFLLKMGPGITYPKHRHPAGEEILVLKGEMTVGIHSLKAGDFLYSPAGSVHEASTVGGCVFLSIVPEPIRFIGVGSHDDRELSTEDIPAPPMPSTEGPIGE